LFNIPSNLSGNLITSSAVNLNSIACNAVTPVEQIFWPKNVVETDIVFLRLYLLNSGGQIQSENFYWLSYPLNNPTQDDFVALGDFRKDSIPVNGSTIVTTKDGNFISNVTIRATQFAFFIRLSLIQGQQTGSGDNRILPSWYSDNYFSLLPGESKSVLIECTQQAAQNRKPWVQVSGWNVQPTILQSTSQR